MVDDPLEELRHIRRTIEQACAESRQTYAQFLSQVQRKYAHRLVRRAPKPRLKMQEGHMVPGAADTA
jgi:hypothetical protein